MNKVYGYVRVSSLEQNEARQMIALKNAGVSKRLIFKDKQSGKDLYGKARNIDRAKSICYNFKR